MKDKWQQVSERVANAHAIAWDNCHKIYVLMDSEQVKLMREYGYDPLITKDQATADSMLNTLKKWYENSCGLRFIEAVSTATGFESLIEQCWQQEAI